MEKGENPEGKRAKRAEHIGRRPLGRGKPLPETLETAAGTGADKGKRRQGQGNMESMQPEEAVQGKEKTDGNKNV